MQLATPKPLQRYLHRSRNEAAEVWAIVWPVLLTNLLKVSVGIADFKMVGILGVTSIAAVGMSRQVMMFLMVLMIAVSGGSSVLVAHAYGAGDQQRVSQVSARAVALMLALAIGVVTPLGTLCSRPLLVMLGAGQEVADLGQSYLRILFLGNAFSMFNFVVTGLLLGVGRTKVSLVLLIGVNAANIALNYLFIFGAGPVPPMGVTGAALGTVTARAMGTLAGIWILTTPRYPLQVRFRDALTIDTDLIRKIFHLGGPRSLQGIVRNFSRLMTIRIITLLPDATKTVSAYSVGMQVRMISSFVGLAFMSAAMSRVGQNMGAGDPEAAEQSGCISAGLATGLMSIVAALLFIFPSHIMGFFTSDESVIGMGRTFFMIIALTEPIMASAFAFGGALRGGGDPISPFIYASVSDLVVVIGLGYVLAIHANLGFTGIAIAMAASAFTRAIPTMAVFLRGRWKDTDLLH